MSLVEADLLTWLLVPAGVVAGILNVIAGGGSFLTLPILMALGLPADVANGTNRVAVIVQAFVAGGTFKREGQLDWRLFRRLLPPLFLGAIGGAWLATWLNPDSLRVTFGVLFLLVGALLLAREFRNKGEPSVEETKPRPPLGSAAWKEQVLLFMLGIYGGFLQAGVALFILLVSVHLFGESALKVNAIKLPLVMTFTVPAFAIFIWAGQVRWWPGILLASGSVIGSLLGVRLTMLGGAKLIMRTVTATLLVTGVALLLQ